MSRAAKPAATTSNTKQPAQQGWKDKLYPEDYEHLKTTFETFDEDHSGLIDPE
jgi:Ca2+-binding EF-hand superfamily protein